MDLVTCEELIGFDILINFLFDFDCQIKDSKELLKHNFLLLDLADC